MLLEMKLKRDQNKHVQGEEKSRGWSECDSKTRADSFFMVGNPIREKQKDRDFIILLSFLEDCILRNYSYEVEISRW